MSRTFFLPEPLYNYICEVSLRESPLQRELREETQRTLPDQAIMQIGPDQAQFMQLLVRIMGAQMYLEVGVFTGYSTLAVALALPADGHIVALDVSEEYGAVARRYWKRAGVASKIDFQIRPAIQSLDTLLQAGAAGSFDFAFIDADKAGYDAYYERCLRLVRSGGLIAIDNVFRNGEVADPVCADDATETQRFLNAKIGKDERVDEAMVPIADGLTLVRKR